METLKQIKDKLAKCSDINRLKQSVDELNDINDNTNSYLRYLSSEIDQLRKEVQRLQPEQPVAKDKTTWPIPGKEYYFLDIDGVVGSGEFNIELPSDRGMLAIGDCFETPEEAEKAVEKLKAFKRLQDKGFKFVDWECADFDGYTMNIVAKAGRPPLNGEDLDLLFYEEDKK